MAKMKIEVERYWNAARVRNLCIEMEYYTRGDNDEYGRMLLFVDNHKPTKENIYRVAEDIFRHSEHEFCKRGEDADVWITAVMFEISRKCVTEHFKINREA